MESKSFFILAAWFLLLSFNHAAESSGSSLIKRTSECLDSFDSVERTNFKVPRTENQPALCCKSFMLNKTSFICGQFNSNRNSDIKCDICGSNISYYTFFETLLMSDQLPEGVRYKYESVFTGLTKMVTYSIINGSATINFILNAIKLGIPFNYIPLGKQSSILNYAAAKLSLDTFSVLYESGLSFVNPNSCKYHNLLFHSLNHLNFSISEYLVSKERARLSPSYLNRLFNALTETFIKMSHPDNFDRNQRRNYYEQVFDWLLKRGADPNSTDSNDKVPLVLHAIINQNEKALKLLLEAGANLNAIDNDGKSLRKIFLLYGTPFIEKVLLDFCLSNSSGSRVIQELFYKSVMDDNFEFTKYFFEKRKKLRLSLSPFVDHLLHYFTAHNRKAFIEYFLKNGANPLEKMIDSVYEILRQKFEFIFTRLTKNDPPIAIAIMMNQIRLVKIYLDAGVDPNTILCNGKITLARLAIELDYFDIVNLLLSRGGLFRSEKSIESPLLELSCGHTCFLSDAVNSLNYNFFKCIKCHVQFDYNSLVYTILSLEELPVDTEISIDTFSSASLEFIMKLIIYHDPTLRIVKNALKLRIPLQKLKTNPLNFAAMSAKLETFKILYECDLNLSSKDLRSHLILILLSLDSSNFSVTDYLFTKNSVFEIPQKLEEMLCFIMSRKKILIGFTNYPKVIKNLFIYMKERGADFNFSFGPQNFSLLHFAVIYDDEFVAKELLKAGANENAVDLMKKIPIYLTVALKNTNVLDVFHDNGTDIHNIFAINGLHLFHISIFFNNLVLAKYFVSLGIAPKTRNGQFFYGIHFSVSSGHLEMVEYLLRIGVNPLEICSPLVYAMMMKKDPDLEQKVLFGDPPICVAIVKDRLDIVELFLNFGVSPNHRIRNSTMSLLDFACRNDKENVARLLILRGAQTSSIDSNGRRIQFESIGNVDIKKIVDNLELDI